ncbi:MAG: PD-(D/E)XK nuclease family protein [Holosporales bacterium]|nr:PD-(D/E)XK nuclease family protein [Holosporales bacterium]
MTVFSIPSATAFLDVLADQILYRYHCTTDLLSLRCLHVVLPTKRACRKFTEALKRQAKTPIFFPQMHALAAVQETQTESNLERTLRFFSFIQHFLRDYHAASSPYPLFTSIPALISLLDEAFLYETRAPPLDMTSERVTFFCALYKAVTHSPELTALLGACQTHTALQEVITQIHSYPKNPIVLAGITSIFPKMLEVFRLVNEQSNSMIVFPELIQLDPAVYATLTPEHPQYALYTILKAISLSPKDVLSLGDVPEQAIKCTQCITSALTEQTKNIATAPPPKGVTLIEAAHAQEEAFIIALLLREAFETPLKMAALVTVDTDLVRRVEAYLKRWNLTADVSQGRPLIQTQEGIFALLCAEVMEENFADIPLLALLKHPFSLLPIDTILEIEQELRKGQETLVTLLETPDLFPRIKDLVAVPPAEEAGFLEFVSFHERLFTSFLSLEAIRSLEKTNGVPLFRHLKVIGNFTISKSAYRRLFAHLLKTQVKRGTEHESPRLFIWGPLEARLLHVDRIIWGGLNDEAWIKTKAADRWLSQKERQQLGLHFHDQRMGFLAHNFVSAFGAEEVFLTRTCLKKDVQTCPVLWLKLLEAYFGNLHPWREQAAYYTWLALYAYGQQRVKRVNVRPIPCPSLSVRPTSLSVTDVELLIRNPYAVYARHILGLKPLADLAEDPAPLRRGNYVHKALEYMAHHLPEEEAQAFLDYLLCKKFPVPEILLYWRSRLERILAWCLQKFLENRPHIAKSYTEIRGTLTFPDFDFTLISKADRLDILDTGSVQIIDYKTGILPKEKDLRCGIAPQLPLEAAIATFGSFPPLKASSVEALIFWHLKGDFSSCTEVIYDEAHTWAEAARLGMERLLKTYQEPTRGYPAYPLEAIAPVYDAYAHLARVKEWR